MALTFAVGLLLGMCFQFWIQVEIANAQVEVDLMNSTYTLTSENYPLPYPNNAIQHFVFTTYDTHEVLLVFDIIHTEQKWDTVKVGNGNITNQQLLLTWSGGPAINQVKVKSSGNVMWLTFDTDGTNEEQGFSATLISVNPLEELNCGGDFDCGNGVCIPLDSACSDREAICGNLADEGYECIENIFVNSSYTFTSANFPSDYPNDRNRLIVFRTFDTHRLLMSFDVLHTEEKFDKVKIGDGDVFDQQELLFWTGGPVHNGINVMSSESLLWFTFDSDGGNTEQGFSAVVEAVAQTANFDCGDEFDCTNGVCIPWEFACHDSSHDPYCGNLFDENGCRVSRNILVDSPFNFTSVNFPSSYPDNHQIDMVFTTTETHQLLLIFNNISTEKSYDIVKIGNGNIPNEGLLLTWSGDSEGGQVKVLSSDKFMWLTFAADSSQSEQGFSGIIQPVYNYQRDLDCGNEFNCRIGVCIPQNSFCDNSEECSNSRDEANCLETCTPTQFKCSNNFCIEQNMVCDNVRDCKEGEDEVGCSGTCSPTQFSCSDGSCISQTWICDNIDDCQGGEDEVSCNGNCDSTQFQCMDGSCIAGSWICDYIVDCMDGDDEVDCIGECNATQFQCLDGSCISRNKICNTARDCLFGEDESDCKPTALPTTNQLQNTLAMTQQQESSQSSTSASTFSTKYPAGGAAYTTGTTRFIPTSKSRSTRRSTVSRSTIIPARSSTITTLQAVPCILPTPNSVNVITNAEGNEVQDGMVIEYSCEDGYILKGITTALCVRGSLVPPQVPTCEAKSCSTPTILNEKLMHEPVAFEYRNGSYIEYTCVQGYAVDGNLNALCLFGEWVPSDVPGCEAFETLDERLLNVSNKLSQENITSEIVAAAAQDIETATNNEKFVEEDTGRVELIVNSLESVVEAGDPSIEVTEPVVRTINNLMNVDEDIIEGSTANSGRITAALEQQISNLQTNDGNYTKTFENVGVSAVKINKTIIKRDLVFGSFVSGDKSPSLDGDLRDEKPQIYADREDVPLVETVVSVSLPSNILDLLHNEEDNSNEIPISFIIYSNSKLHPLDLSKRMESLEGENNEESSASNITERIASRIISARVESSGNNTVTTLPAELPVITKFITDLSVDITEVIDDIECVHWDYDRMTEKGSWSKDGCKKMDDEGSLTVCSCNQLASFAVLVRVRGNYESSVPLYFITLIGSIISCTCLVLCIVTFVSLRKLRTKQPTHIHINLCVSLLGFYIAFLLSTVAVNKPVFCAISSAVIHFFSLATVGWMSVEAINMYILFVKKDQRRYRYFIPIACVFGYGCPLIASVLVAVLDNASDYTNTYCFIHPGFAFYFGFLAEVVVLFVLNLIIFIWVIREMLCRPLMVSRTRRGARRKEIITRVRHGILFWFVLGLSWVFGFAAALDTKTQIFQYLYCICIAKQGLVMFLLLCVANPEFRKSVTIKNLTASQKRGGLLGRSSTRTTSTLVSKATSRSESDFHMNSIKE